MDIQILLDALDNEDVRSKIRTILAEKNNNTEIAQQKGNASSSSDIIRDTKRNKILEDIISELKSILDIDYGKYTDQEVLIKVKRLSEQIIEKDKLVKKSQADYKLIFHDYNKLREDIEVFSKQLEFYNKNFQDELQISKLYNGFSEKTRISLSGIFKNTTVQGLIACGIQEKNISNFWDYMKNEIVNGGNDDINNINILFNILFKRFMLAYPMIAYQNLNVGDSFDTQHHIKHNSSVNHSGKIEQILLKGYVNIKTEKVIKPSIVVL